MGERVVVHVPGPDHFAAERKKRIADIEAAIERETDLALSDCRGPIEVFFSEHGEDPKRLGILKDGYIVNGKSFATPEEAKTYLMESLEFSETDADDHVAALEQLDHELMAKMSRDETIQSVTVSDRVWVNKHRDAFIHKIFT